MEGFHTFTKSVALCLLFFVVATPAYALSPNDTLIKDQWYLDQIGARNAWNETTGSSSVIVAILDTGFDEDHPDLKGNLWTNLNEVPGDGKDNDGNGIIDDLHGYDFVDYDGDPVPRKGVDFDEEAIPHGTIIAGIIGAVGNNGEGIAGLNWDVRLMNVRILDNQGIGDSISATAGIDYAVENGADVINLSFTGLVADPEFRRVLRRAYKAGVVVVAAVGNADDDGPIDTDEIPMYPVCYGENAKQDWIIGVASSDQADQLSKFSNYGSVCTDITAPGEFILSTMLQDDTWGPFALEYYGGGWSGTSMAAPMVAGAAALIKAKYPNASPDEVKQVLRLSADPVGTQGLTAGKAGSGRLNIAKAFEIAPNFIDTLESVVATIEDAAPNSLVKIRCVGETTVQDPCHAVYFYGSDGKRHAFTNEKVFFTWYENFDSVVEISKSSMSSLTLGKNVTYHPATKLVKFLTVKTVYAVSAGGVLRAITTESIAEELYGSDWNKKIDDIQDVFLGNYKFGTKIVNASDYDVEAERSSVKGLDEHFSL